MEIGPFGLNDINAITEMLQEAGIEFEIVIDEEEKVRQTKLHNEQAEQQPRNMAGRLNLQIVYFEMNETAYEKVKTNLEKFGFGIQSDGTFELGEDSE